MKASIPFQLIITFKSVLIIAVDTFVCLVTNRDENNFVVLIALVKLHPYSIQIELYGWNK